MKQSYVYIAFLFVMPCQADEQHELPGSGVRGARDLYPYPNPYQTSWSSSSGPTPGQSTNPPVSPAPTPGTTTYLPVTPGPTPGMTTYLPVTPGPTTGMTTSLPVSPGPTPGSTTTFPSGSPGPTPCPTMDLVDYNMTECCTCPNTTNASFTEPVTFEQYESLFAGEFDNCGCTCECDADGGGIWRNRELQFGTGAYFPGGACHGPTQRERRRGMDFDGQVKFVDCDTSDIRLIPEEDDGDPYVAPASNVVDDIDGFCIKGSSQWFKIPNHCKVLITCTPKNSKPEAGFPDAGKPGKIKWKYFCEDFEGLKVDCYNIFATVTFGVIVEPKHDSTKPAWRDPYGDWPDCMDTKHW